MNRQDIYFEDAEPGTRYTSETHLVTAEDIARFCELTRDHHPLHTDAQYARTRGFPGVIAHGLYGLALMEGLKTSLGLYENSSIASLGWDDVRFVRAVVAGDRVHVAFEFVDKRPTSKPGRGIVHEMLYLINQHGQIVIQARHASLLACRASTTCA
ncbi:monoamine oxidase [Verticiella sediminum]|uniref:Monoamine oxidase n=1 Tax=Verticiella sediminum TaxID=1247510 RepID=A0A556A7C8_9BURK|nr:MaoC family dehydratase [Verticiella sediminum]TSH88796.1 monoamine oxidase [Verticiella sediminum]